MEKKYIVNGASGQYSDYTTWDICVYTDKVIAMEHADKAKAFVEDLYIQYPNNTIPYGIKNPYDPRMSLNVYGDLEYYVTETTQYDSVEEALLEMSKLY